MGHKRNTLRLYEERINRVMDAVAANLERVWTLDELARVAPFSPFHLHRIFFAITGETLGAFMRRIRLERAAMLLLWQPGSTITTIAHACGFSSSQNMARAFRQHFGVAPVAYRAANSVVARAGEAQNGKQGNALGMTCGQDGAMPVLGLAHVVLPETLFQEAAMMQVDVREMPVMTVAYMRHVGPYAPETLGPFWGRFMERAGRLGLLHPAVQTLGVSWDDPSITPPEKCRYDASIVVPDSFTRADGLNVQTVGGGLYAVYRRLTACDAFPAAWHELLGVWLPASGWQADDRSCFELYNNIFAAPAEGPWDVSYCLPVRKL